MDKKPLIGVSICAVVLLILASLTNVVGYQTVQSSNQKAIHDEVDQKELLFQTIVDIANNKDIQRVILEYQIGKEGFFNPDVKFSVSNNPVLTKNHLKQMYLVGLCLSKTISKSRMYSLIERYQVNNQWVQKEVTDVIEKDATLKVEITQLSNSKCDCENDNTIRLWSFPVLCGLLGLIFTCIAWIYMAFFMIWGNAPNFVQLLYEIILIIGKTLNCSYVP
jgi:hypothetical protein